MSITIPRAGVIAGRAAQVRVEADQTGAVISEFGDAMMKQAAKWQAEKLDMAGKKAQIGIARDLGLARQEAEQLGDPEAIGTFWDTRYGEIREKWLNGTDENGQPLIAPELREGLGLTLDELNNRHGLALGEKAIGLRQSQREAEWITMREQVTLDAASAGDPQSRAALLEIGEAAIDSRAAAGIITPAEAAREKIALRNDVTSARATALIAEDPAGFLDRAEAGEFNALGAETLATRRVQAQSALDRMNAEAAKAAELMEQQQSAEIGKRLGVMTDLMSEGFTVTDEAFLTDPRVQAHPDFPAAQAAQSLRDELPGIRQATVAELDAAIAAEEAAPKTHKYQTERVKVLRQWRDEAAARWNSNAVEQARRANMPVPDLPADPTDPGFADRFAARLSLDEGLRGSGHTQTQAVLDDREKAALKATLAPAADPEAKLALADAVLRASRGNPGRALEVLEADPEFTRAVELMGRTGQTSTAEAILRGQQKLARKVTSLPPLGQRQLLFDELTQGAYADDPVLASKILSAASAIYADRAAGVDPEGAASKVPFMSDTEAVDIFRGAVELAAGIQSDGAGRNPVGGFAVVKGQGLVIPPGISARQVELAEEAVGYRLQGLVRIPEANATGFRGAAGGGGWYTRDSLKAVSGAEMPAQPSGLDILTAASLDGRMPALGDEATASRRWDNMRFVRAPGQPEGSDAYELRWVDQYGEEHPVRAVGGAPYRFSLSRLIREAAK